jgi:transcriptional regulator with XRE-family HTH domain
MTVPKAAALMGTSSTYLYRRLNGETVLDIKDIERLAEILNVSVISLLPVREQTEGVTGANFQTPTLIPVQIGRAA